MGTRVAPRRGGPPSPRGRLIDASVSAAAVFATIALGVGLAACEPLGIVQDPMKRDAIAALGAEDPAIPAGPRHRAGQPCGVCHSEGGTADTYVFAGTVYRDPASRVPVADVEVSFIDVGGKTFKAKTNCVGNFFVKPRDFAPGGPTWVAVQLTDLPYTMESPIHRESSCAICHHDPAGTASAGHVFLTDDESTYDSIPTRPCGPEDEGAR